MLYKGVFVVVFSLNIAQTLCGGCTISINNDLGDPQPLVLKPDNNNGSEAFYVPNDGDVINFSDGDVVRVACPGSTILVDGDSTTKTTDNAVCNDGKFNINGASVPFVDITCGCYPSHLARYTGESCLGDKTEIEIGFDVDGNFIRSILICFDGNEDNPLYSTFDLTKTIAGYQVSFPRPGWLQGSFYSVTGVNTLYTRATQRKTINALLGLPSDSYQYVAKSGDLYLTRGHLSAKTDFLYGSQHRLTFYFVNAVPQWQTFNAVNWGKLEDNVRAYASETQKDLKVYTGTYGATTLKHNTTGEDVKLYLSVNGDVKKLPVPQIVWKVVYEPTTKSGVALVGINNPYRTESDLAQDIICKDVSDQISWVTWNRTNLQNGYGYCCSVPDFRQTVTTLPDFEVTQLLI